MNDKIVIVNVIDGDGNLLLIRRSSVDDNAGIWESPAGHVDPGETAAVAGVREVKEETGLDVFLFPYHTTISTPKGPAAYYLGSVGIGDGPVKPEVTVHPQEHDAYRWIPFPLIAKVTPTHKNNKKNLLELFRKIQRKTHPSGRSASVSLTLYRGQGSGPGTARRNRVPAQFAVGQYWSTHEEVAATYGPDVVHREITLNNPYIFRLGERPYYDEMRRAFGTSDPEEVTAWLRERGHDALIVENVPVHRFRVDTKEPVTLRDSTEVILLGTGVRSRESSMKRRLTAEQDEIQPSRYMRKMPGPGEELKEAILVGDQVEIFLQKHIGTYETPEPAVSGVVERRNRDTIWIRDLTEDEEGVRSVNWDDRGSWSFVRVYRDGQGMVCYVNGNPYDPDGATVSNAKGIGLILESDPPPAYEAMWSLMRGETPDLDRTLGQVPQSLDAVAPFRQPKAGVPRILHQVRETLGQYGMDPDIVDSMGRDRVLILTQDKDLKRDIMKVLKGEGKEVTANRSGGLVVRDRVAQGATTIPIETDDDLMILSLNQKRRERDRSRQSAVPINTMPLTTSNPGTSSGFPQQTINFPSTEEQISTVEQKIGPLNKSKGPGGNTQVTFRTPAQQKRFDMLQLNSGQTKISSVKKKEIFQVARQFRREMSRQDFEAARRCLTSLIRLGVRESALVRTRLAARRDWANFSHYLEAMGEVRGSRLARSASRIGLG